MSSPRKKSIREARLEKIEELLEQHEKSMCPKVHATFMFMFIRKFPLRCALCNGKNELKMLNCVFNLEAKANKRKRIEEILKIRINTICSASRKFYNCERNVKSHFIQSFCIFVLQFNNKKDFSFVEISSLCEESKLSVKITNTNLKLN